MTFLTKEAMPRVTELASFWEPTSSTYLDDGDGYDVQWEIQRLPDVNESWTTFNEVSIDELIRLPLINGNLSGIDSSGVLEPLTLFDAIAHDHMHFYSLTRMRDLSVGVAVAAALANTRADEGIRDDFLDNITNVGVGEYAEEIHKAKFLGDGFYTLPLFAGMALTGRLFDEAPPLVIGGEWGERSLRTILVGGPPMLGLQYALGASRPDETHEKSEWQPFQDNNGVSGHAFMGAIPFLSAAKMTDDPYLKATFYVASTLPGLSRITDDDHYPSQVLLGWWIAYLAASAADDTYEMSENVTVFPLLLPDGIGFAFELRR